MTTHNNAFRRTIRRKAVSLQLKLIEMNPLITAFLQMFTINSCNTNINANFTTNLNVNVNYDINLDLTLAVSITASFAVCATIYLIGKWTVRRFNN